MRILLVLIGAAVAMTVAVTYLDHRAHREIEALRGELSRRDVAGSAAAPLDSSILPRLADRIPSYPEAEPQTVGPARATGATGKAVSPVTDHPRARRPESRLGNFAPISDMMEAAFVGEVADPSWARDAHKTVATAFTNELPDGSRIKSIDCRSTLCRIETIHDNHERATEFIGRVVADPAKRPWNGSFAAGPIAENPAGGLVTLVTYLMREGAELPHEEIDEP